LFTLFSLRYFRFLALKVSRKENKEDQIVSVTRKIEERKEVGTSEKKQKGV